MTRRRKIVIGLIACAFAVLILMLAAVLIIPKLIDVKWVKDEIPSLVKKNSACAVEQV